MANLIKIPARKGVAAVVRNGQIIKIINTHGHQVVDTWVFNSLDLDEFLSNEHMHEKLNSLFPQVGKPIYTNKRRAIAILEEDTSPGVHDTVMAACDIYRYQQLGCSDYHDNCDDNLHAALGELGHSIEGTPSPLNLWMNIPVDEKGNCGWEAPVSKAGDFVCFRAVMDCIFVMSACPQDLVPINAGNPVEAHFQVLD
ncbi:MAG: aminomethyltransferase [Rhodospirillaceae bacterium]|nr:aminomethyltransferase [Rhodospirillaceae bacterium]|tara:strand:- start:42 stop:635 length:594 start_codon:yes stop_codon:yes gene_type:complete